ncbi:MAG: hypothetical protein ACREA0_10505 [bacterium]
MKQPGQTATQADTSRPALPPLPILTSDSTFTVEGSRYPRSQLLYYRNIVGVVFDDSTSGVTIRRLLTSYEATVIGGVPGPAGDPEYILQVPDPGATIEALDSLLAQLNGEAGVKRASSVYYRTPASIKLRHPNNSPGARRQDWSSPPDATSSGWPVLTDRYPVLDTSRVVQLEGDTFQVYRTDITIRFKVGVSDSAKRVFFNRHSMTVVGVTQSGQFFVRIPDPGPSAQHLFDALKVLGSEPEASIVSFIPRTPLPQSQF